MANAKRGEVLLDIGGEDRVIKFDFNAIARLEQMHGGEPIHVLMEPSRFGIGVLRNALYCALVSGEPRRARTISPDKVGEWLTEASDRLEEIATKLMEAVQFAMPGSGGDPNPPTPAPPSVAAAGETRPAVNEDVRVAIGHTADVKTPNHPGSTSST